MKHVAKLSSKYQASIPSGVRDALGLRPGDRLVFEVEGGAVSLRRYPTLEELAGTFPAPPDVADLSWSEIRDRAWAPPTTTRRTSATAARRTKRR